MRDGEREIKIGERSTERGEEHRETERGRRDRERTIGAISTGKGGKRDRERTIGAISTEKGGRERQERPGGRETEEREERDNTYVVGARYEKKPTMLFNSWVCPNHFPQFAKLQSAATHSSINQTLLKTSNQ